MPARKPKNATVQRAIKEKIRKKVARQTPANLSERNGGRTGKRMKFKDAEREAKTTTIDFVPEVLEAVSLAANAEDKSKSLYLNRVLADELGVDLGSILK